MAHTVELTIDNQTGKTLFLDESWFWKGKLNDKQFFPLKILNNTSVRIISSGGDHCSGYVSYITGDSRITIGFSNPSSGRNKLGVGLTGKKVWDDMTNHDYKPFEENFQLNDSSVITCNCLCTGSDTNKASVKLLGQSTFES